jgi:hypothetical protein
MKYVPAQLCARPARAKGLPIERVSLVLGRPGMAAGLRVHPKAVPQASVRPAKGVPHVTDSVLPVKAGQPTQHVRPVKGSVLWARGLPVTDRGLWATGLSATDSGPWATVLPVTDSGPYATDKARQADVPRAERVR